MRSLLLFALLIVSGLTVPGQTIAPRGPVAAGGSDPPGMLSWSVGQISGASFTNGPDLLTAGIQQPDRVSIAIQLRVFLGGPYQAVPGLMSDALRAASLLPLQEPYTGLGFAHYADGGGEQVPPVLLSTTGNNAIVDWIFIELRNASTPQMIVATRAALVQRDGDVVDTDGVSPVRMTVPAGTYHIAVKHRNHLAVMTALPFLISSQPTALDLTDGSVPMYGTNAQDVVGGTRVLWPGDASADGLVRYSGTLNDRAVILAALGASSFLTPLAGYHSADLNLNGLVSYSGTSNDRTVILSTVGATTYLIARSAQLP
jgi:hypothetical protein